MDEENPFSDGAPSDNEVPHDFKNAGRQKQNIVDRTHRQPPHSDEAEMGVLGCVLLSPSECIPQCIDLFRDRSDVFYDLRHRAIYEMAVSLYDKQKAVDVVTVLQALRDAKQLDSVGGVSYLASLPDAVPSAANLLYYVDIVREKAVLRESITVCANTISLAHDGYGDIGTFLEKFGQSANKLIQGTFHKNGSGGVRSAKQLIPLVNERMQSLYDKTATVLGLSTGYPELDAMTLGLHPGQVFVLAARPSVGKSAIAMNIADHVAAEQKKPVGVFSLEMPAEDLMLRMTCARARVDLKNVMSGETAKQEIENLGDACKQLIKVPLYIDDTRSLSILQAKAKARQMKQQYGIKLFIFDYLQLMHSSNHRAQNREQEVSDVSHGIHDIAGELNVPVILIAQLNREIERHGSRRPRLSDLRESGSIEQDADTVGMLYRDAQKDDDSYWSNTNPVVHVNLLIAKQRNGPTGEIPMVFHRTFTRFESVSTQNKLNEQNQQQGQQQSEDAHWMPSDDV